MTTRPDRQGLDCWLDADREDGYTDIVLTDERIREAHEHNLLQGGGRDRHAYGRPINLMSERDFAVIAMQVRDLPNPLGTMVRVVRGEMEMLQVKAHLLASDTAWPTRVCNPMRQNLGFGFMWPDEPLTLRVWWKHRKKPFCEGNDRKLWLWPAAEDEES